jgi:hypothetical protein
MRAHRWNGADLRHVLTNAVVVRWCVCVSVVVCVFRGDAPHRTTLYTSACRALLVFVTLRREESSAPIQQLLLRINDPPTVARGQSALPSRCHWFDSCLFFFFRREPDEHARASGPLSVHFLLISNRALMFPLALLLYAVRAALLLGGSGV